MQKSRPICGLTRQEFLDHITAFHNYPAPGLVVGGFMVDLARQGLPDGTLFEALCETQACLPDAVQLFTPCTLGNGWLRVKDLGRYALTLYDKYTGHGFRVWVDPVKLQDWPEIAGWFLKTTPKKEQDSGKLQDEIFAAGTDILSVAPATVGQEFLGKHSKGEIVLCPVCREAYPARDGAVCLGCAGQAPARAQGTGSAGVVRPGPRLTAVPVDQALGRKALHDMTEVIPGQSKGAAFHKGHTFTSGDLCRLQRMGRMEVYVQDGQSEESLFLHEDEAALALSAALCRGGSVEACGPPREGKITLSAACDGLLWVDEDRLAAVNTLGDVAIATRHAGVMVKKGQGLAGVRAIPLYVEQALVDSALAVILSGAGPVVEVKALRRARAGALITGTEVFTGLIEDKFAPVLAKKLSRLGSELVRTAFAPDEAPAIARGVRELVEAGCDLILTTAGMSVDPGDVTRLGLEQAGLRDAVFGMPVLPGNMTLVGRVGDVPVLGVPACALFHPATSLDLLLPRVLAGMEITRGMLARMGHGGFCVNCERCVFPHCPFGK